MVFLIALLAAFGVAIFNGIAAILEKIGAGQVKTATSPNPNLLWRLKGNTVYLFGIILDFLAWILTLYAVHTLPLFLVQPIIACSIIITILIEYFLFKHKLGLKFIVSIIVILVGLVLLALVSTPEKVLATDHYIRWIIILTPLGLVVIGSVFCFIQKKYSAFVLSVISGLGFGCVSIAGRMISLSHPYFHVLYNPLSWSIVGYGLSGILFFTIALQRARASVVNATMIASGTLLPIIIGLVFLGDHPKNNLWLVTSIGISLTFGGIIMIATSSMKNEKLQPSIHHN
jgi:drug/metabolite transporter (DMT)-like permease